MDFKITREQVREEIAAMRHLSPRDREHIVEGLDFTDLARSLSSRLEEEVNRFLEE